jgi:tetratricopeptide (TPR) repeat protein
MGAEWLRTQAQRSTSDGISLGQRQTRRPDEDSDAGEATRSLLGTYAYMSPEQKRGEEADARSDVYAVGLVAFRLLTGRQTVEFDLPSAIDPTLVAEWDVLIKKSVRPRLGERYASAGEMAAAVESIRESVAEGPPHQKAVDGIEEARALRERGDYEGATQRLRDVMEIAPENGEAAELLEQIQRERVLSEVRDAVRRAENLEAQQRLEEAFEGYRTAHELMERLSGGKEEMAGRIELAIERVGNRLNEIDDLCSRLETAFRDEDYESAEALIKELSELHEQEGRRWRDKLDKSVDNRLEEMAGALQQSREDLERRLEKARQEMPAKAWSVAQSSVFYQLALGCRSVLHTIPGIHFSLLAELGAVVFRRRVGKDVLEMIERARKEHDGRKQSILRDCRSALKRAATNTGGNAPSQRQLGGKTNWKSALARQDARDTEEVRALVAQMREGSGDDKEAAIEKAERHAASRLARVWQGTLFDRIGCAAFTGDIRFTSAAGVAVLILVALFISLHLMPIGCIAMIVGPVWGWFFVDACSVISCFARHQYGQLSVVNRAGARSRWVLSPWCYYNIGGAPENDVVVEGDGVPDYCARLDYLDGHWVKREFVEGKTAARGLILRDGKRFVVGDSELKFTVLDADALLNGKARE